MPGRLMTQQTEDSAGEGGGEYPVWKARRIKKGDSRDKGIAANDKENKTTMTDDIKCLNIWTVISR